MRKLLLSSTAIATAAILSANAAVADVSISAATEFTYVNRASTQTTLDGDSYGTESEITFKFSNKTDSGLNIAYEVQLESDDTDTAINESFLTISGGFGSIVLGGNDFVGDNYGIEAEDLIAEEGTHLGNAYTVASASIGTDTDIVGTDTDLNKIAYHLPAMGGFTGGISFTDSGDAEATDTTAFGAQYAMTVGGTAITIGGATSSTEVAAAENTDSQNLGVKLVNGNLSVILAVSDYETADDDVSSKGISASYKLSDDVTLAAWSMISEDDLEVGEEYTAAGVEVQYTIAAGLKAILNVTDYEYTAATTPNSDGTATSDSGTGTKLVIQATF
jgi:hypothetical protein